MMFITMFKSICFLAVIITVANAGEYEIQVTNAAIFAREYSQDYIDTTKQKGKVDTYTWKEDTGGETLPVEVKYVMYQFVNKERESKTVELPDLCGSYDDQDQKNLQNFVLTVLGKTSTCPIAKDTKVEVKKKYSFSFTSESEYCVSLFSILNLIDKRQDHEILEYRFEGEMKGKSCEK